MAGLIVPLVEGQSEVLGFGGLLRRLLHRLQVYDVHVAQPFRVPRSRVVRGGEVERAVRMAVASRDGATAVMVVLDADRDCPARLGPELLARCRAVTALPVGVVIPTVEIEAWILASIESLRGRRGVSSAATAPRDPENVRDAKGAISDRMEGNRGYVATDDLPAFLATLDVELAERRSPSFGKLVREVRRIVSAS